MLSVILAATLVCASPIRPAEWQYPGARVISRGGGGGSGAMAGFQSQFYQATTPDDFDAVCAYFLKRAEVKAARNGAESGNDGSVAVLDGSSRRPLKLKTIVKTVNRQVVTVVISRADTEKVTYIDFFYRGENP